MTHERREDHRGDRYSGESYPPSVDVSQYRLSEIEYVEGPPQTTAPPHPQYWGYGPWNVPPPHPGVQEPCGAVPGANGSTQGPGAWYETRRNPPPVPGSASRYTDQGLGNAGGAIPRHWDNGNPTGATCVYSPPLASNSQPNGMADQGPTPAANVHSAAGTNAWPYTPAINAPVLSEYLKTLARHLILDQGTRVNVLNVEASGSGRLKVMITLETADIV